MDFDSLTCRLTNLFFNAANYENHEELPYQSSLKEKDYNEWKKNFEVFETGYSHLQGTKPQSLTVGLTDSPVGFLAWIHEKYHAWSDHGDDIWETFDREWVLTNVTLYWLTNSVLSTSRIYFEHYNTYGKESLNF